MSQPWQAVTPSEPGLFKSADNNPLVEIAAARISIPCPICQALLVTCEWPSIHTLEDVVSQRARLGPSRPDELVDTAVAFTGFRVWLLVAFNSDCVVA